MKRLTPAQQKIVDALKDGKEVRMTELAGRRYYQIEGSRENANPKAIRALEEQGVIQSEYFSGIYRLVTR